MIINSTSKLSINKTTTNELNKSIVLSDLLNSEIDKNEKLTSEN